MEMLTCAVSLNPRRCFIANNNRMGKIIPWSSSDEVTSFTIDMTRARWEEELPEFLRTDALFFFFILWM
jgi:hypothetical protein